MLMLMRLRAVPVSVALVVCCHYVFSSFCQYLAFLFVLFFFFFKQKTAYEIVSRDWSSDVCSSDLAFYTDQFSLRQHPRFLYCPFLVAAAPRLFIVPISRCGSTPAFYTVHFSLRQRPGFLYCPFLVAAADRKSVV